MPGRNVERRCSDVLQGCAEPSSAFVPDDRPQRLDCADEQGFEATLPSATQPVPSKWITQRSAPAHGRRMRDHGPSPAKCLSPSGRGSAIAVISWSGRSTQSISARAISGWRGVPRALSVPALGQAARGRPSSCPAGTAAAQLGGIAARASVNGHPASLERYGINVEPSNFHLIAQVVPNATVLRPTFVLQYASSSLNLANRMRPRLAAFVARAIR